ncbi:hypothetical protein AeMF1_008402, partial [Aphanomyces euteiches]
MAVLVFSRGANLNSSTTLLFGPNAKEKFSSWLLKTATKFKDELLCLGVSVKEVGTHSFRKGVASELSNSPGGPTPVSVHLRAGWTLGPVQGRYIFSGSGGDQFVGRAAAGLNVNDIEFGALPPHFVGQALDVHQWESILPGYSSFYPQCFRAALPFLLASLVWHYKWLEATLEKNHPLFLSSVWLSGIIPTLSSSVETGLMYNSKTKMKASGVPPHVVISSRLNLVERCLVDVKQQLEQLPSLICDKVLAQLDDAHPTTTPTSATNRSDTHLDELCALIVRANERNNSPTPEACPSAVNESTEVRLD